MLFFTWDKVFNVGWWLGLSVFLFEIFYFLGITWLIGNYNSVLIFTSCFTIITMIYILRASLMIDPKERAVFVTGCDSGFGNRIAIQLFNLGFTVFAGCRFFNGEGAKKLVNHSNNKSIGEKSGGDHLRKIHVVQCDVKNEKEIMKAKDFVKQNLPSKGLWAVVNNAGYMTMGEVEATPMSTFRLAMEVNLMGMVEVTKAFMPLLRKSKGRVVCTSSTNGVYGVPLRSAYCASKYAVEGFANCLRYDVERWGIKVSLIEPGNFLLGTQLAGTMRNQFEEQMEEISPELLAELGKDYVQRLTYVLQKTMFAFASSNVTPVITAYIEAVMQKHPQERYYVLNFKEKIRTLYSVHLPEWIFDKWFLAPYKRAMQVYNSTKNTNKL